MITTERLVLKPLEAAYAKDLLALWSDPDVIRYMNLRLHRRESESRARIKDLLEQNIKKGCPNHFVLMLGEELMGTAGFPLTEQGGHAFGFYYQIAKKHWGCGYATEAAKALTAYIYENYPDAVVYADSVVENAASVALLKKLGFEQTGREAKGFIRNGLEMDILHFIHKK